MSLKVCCAPGTVEGAGCFESRCKRPAFLKLPFRVADRSQTSKQVHMSHHASVSSVPGRDWKGRQGVGHEGRVRCLGRGGQEGPLWKWHCSWDLSEVAGREVHPCSQGGVGGGQAAAGMAASVGLEPAGVGRQQGHHGGGTSGGWGEWWGVLTRGQAAAKPPGPRN